MIPTGAAGAALPTKPGAETQVSQLQPFQSLSATRGGTAAVSQPVTAVAIDPPLQSHSAEAVPHEESNEAARLTEPSRMAPETITKQADMPDAGTPAGPPPTFDWSMLEKARALANSTAPTATAEAKLSDPPAPLTGEDTIDFAEPRRSSADLLGIRETDALDAPADAQTVKLNSDTSPDYLRRTTDGEAL